VNEESCDEYLTQQKPKKRKNNSIVSNVVFFCILFAAVALVFLFSAGGTGAPKNFAGFSIMTVLTGSMQSEIPQGSFVITHKVDPATLQIGDVITFMKDDNTTVTHKIVGIYQDYESSGEIGFVTRGVENPENDAQVVMQENVVGKVIFSNLAIGEVFTLIKDNLQTFIIMTGLFIVLLAALSVFLKNGPAKRTENRTRSSRQKTAA